ncbi:Sugar transporter ERD6-like 6 [Harpegnathos saltator]|uniref:Sugar transporter ERD6-like 6 n=1 Tax=Harpegnathos saltator TaxID=610380 RepID=E2C7K2_HARSA|nr:Sugar transporter ERD6-like 6 [Harpegnathos saltator]
MDHKTEKVVTKRVMWPQWLAGIGVALLMLQMGLSLAWNSPYIAYLTSPESYISMTMKEASWVVSLINFGRIFGAIFGSVSVSYLGSKTTILINSFPIAMCWILTIAANRVEWLYAARFLVGIYIGMTYSSFSLYLAEIADPTIRGALVVLAMSGSTIGSLIISAMGVYLTMEVSGIACLLLCFVVMIIFIWLPESPHHLLKTNQQDKARLALLWYHRDCDVDMELRTLQEFIETNNNLSFINILGEFKKAHLRKALVLLTMLFMYSMMCGLNNIYFYMEIILTNAQVTVIKPAIIVTIVAAFGIAGSILSFFLIDKFGRRFLMISSILACVISLLCLGLQFHLLDAGYDATVLQGLAIFAMILFQVAVFIGMLSVPNTVLGEICPPHVKNVVACFTNIIAGIFSFISTATYQPLIDLITEKYIFFVYALILLTAIPYMLIYLPETKGKSLQQIQEDLTKKS